MKAGKLKYRYNPQGDRIELAQRGQVTRYVIDDAHELSRVLMEMDGEGHVKSRYIYGLGLIGREDADGKYLSYHYDLRGSTTLLTDEQNRVTDRYTYGLYGELEQHEGVTQQPFAYNGRDGVMTDANGLYYMRARYYDPKLKRFLNRDVIRGDIQDGQTFNRYAYVNGNPVNYFDPLGLSKWETKGDRQFLDKPTAGDNKGSMLRGDGDNTLYHYTDEMGAKTISDTGVIRAKNGKVYLTDQKVPSKDANAVLFAGQRPDVVITHRVEVKVKNDFYDRIGVETQDNELIFNGSIKNGKHADFTVKENDFK